MAHGESWISGSLGGITLVSNKGRKKSTIRVSGGSNGSWSKKEPASREFLDTPRIFMLGSQTQRAPVLSNTGTHSIYGALKLKHTSNLHIYNL